MRSERRISARVIGGEAVKGGNWTGERFAGGSGGSGGKGGGRGVSPEVGDGGLTTEAWPGMAQRFCIGKRVREKLTFNLLFSLVLIFGFRNLYC